MGQEFTTRPGEGGDTRRSENRNGDRVRRRGTRAAYQLARRGRRGGRHATGRRGGRRRPIRTTRGATWLFTYICITYAAHGRLKMTRAVGALVATLFINGIFSVNKL